MRLKGLKPSYEIANAVLSMPQPHDKAATRRFLGTITYPSKLWPHLSEVVHPLRDLTHINQEFLWADQQTEAFRQAKHLVSQVPCLRSFDVNAPVVLQVDASEYGLGGALLQPATHPAYSTDISWQPVANCSSFLSPTEQRYALIEKETGYRSCIPQVWPTSFHKGWCGSSQWPQTFRDDGYSSALHIHSRILQGVNTPHC